MVPRRMPRNDATRACECHAASRRRNRPSACGHPVPVSILGVAHETLRSVRPEGVPHEAPLADELPTRGPIARAAASESAAPVSRSAGLPHAGPGQALDSAAAMRVMRDTLGQAILATSSPCLHACWRPNGAVDQRQGTVY